MFIDYKLTPKTLFNSLRYFQECLFEAGLRCCDARNGVDNNITFRGLSLPIDPVKTVDVSKAFGDNKYVLSYQAKKLLDGFYSSVSRRVIFTLLSPPPASRIRNRQESLFICQGMQMFVQHPFNIRLTEIVTTRHRRFQRPRKNVASYTLLSTKMVH